MTSEMLRTVILASSLELSFKKTDLKTENETTTEPYSVSSRWAARIPVSARQKAKVPLKLNSRDLAHKALDGLYALVFPHLTKINQSILLEINRTTLAR